MKTLHLYFSTLAVTLGLAPACEAHSCTMVGWSEGLTVNVTSDEPPTAGTYRFVIEIPNDTFEVDLPLEAPKNTRQGVIVSQRIARSSWQINASLSGLAQAEKVTTLGDITIGRFEGQSGGPQSLTLTVFQDGAQIGSLELADIDYRKTEFNGPGCGVATTATASVSIAPVQ